MDLFEQAEKRLKNYLPSDGCVNYFGKVLSSQQADEFFDQLCQQINWQPDELIIRGKRRVTKRKVAWYGNKPYAYHYSNTRKVAEPWIPVLRELKNIVQEETGESYNACLLNLYHDGTEGMSWHSDAEKELVPGATIASFSLGAQRKFCFRHKQSKERVEIILEHGSLLTMSGLTQLNWLHQLPVSKKVTRARVNLTFRVMQDQ